MQADSAPQNLTYAQAINQALQQVMARDSRVILIGEGVPDPKAIFGTTAGLREEFGARRVFDMPLAENGMTGICIGAALTGMRPVMVHQRIDFALLAMDQLVNNAAKWHYMFNGLGRVPLVVRVIIGRGWGQGPQHSQSLQAMFAHVPGLRVVIPTTPRDAKGMLIAAIDEDNPVLFVEHRWLHNIQDDVPVGEYQVALDKANVLRAGGDVTVAAYSYMVMEALQVARVLEPLGIDVEVLDMRSANPVDEEALLNSVRKTGRLLVLDTGWTSAGMSAELIALATTGAFDSLQKAPLRLASPNFPAPTSHHMTSTYYPEGVAILNGLMSLLDEPLSREQYARLATTLQRKGPLDVPNANFTGPF